MNNKKTWIAWLILIICLAVTLIASIYVKYEIDKKDEAEFIFECKEITSNIELRMHAHSQLLRSGSAFFDASDSITRQDWRNFIIQSKVNLNLPGILGTGFSKVIKQNELEKHTLLIKNEGFTDYKVWPEDPRDVYTSIVYLEPFSKANLRAFGYDMMTESVRREAMERARDHDIAALSGKVLLVQESGSDVQAGNLMYVPVYKKGFPLKTVEQRRIAIKGWVYSPYRMNDLMSGILKNWDLNNEKKASYLKIFDGTTLSPESLLFKSQHTNRGETNKIRFSIKTPIVFNDHVWTLQFIKNKNSIIIYYRPVWLVLVGGILISILFSTLIITLIGTRFRALRIAKVLTSELKESERLLKESNRIASLGTYELDFKTRVWKSSKVFDKILDIDDDYNRKNTDWHNLIHPNHLEPTIGTITNNIINKEQKIDQKFKIIRFKDKKERWIHGLGKIEFDKNSAPVKLIGTIKDITEQKLAEERLKLSREQYSIAVEGSNDGIWDWDINSQEIYYSKRWKGMLGYQEYEITNSMDTWLRLLHPEDKNRATAFLKSYLNEEVKEYEIEFRLKHKDGSYRWILSRGKFLKDEQGKPYRMAGSHTDITSRKLYEEEIKSLSTQNKLILNSVGEGIYGIDLDGKITFVNPIAAEMLGYDAEELIGEEGHTNHHHCYADGSAYPASKCYIYDSLKTGVTNSTDKEVFWHKDGTSFPVEYTSTPLKNDSEKIIGSVIVFKDITLRKRNEEELKQSEKNLRTIIEASPVPIILTKVDGDVIVMANENFGKLFKIPVSEIVGKKSPDFYPNKKERAELIQIAISKGYVDNVELSLKKYDGEQFDCSVSVKLMSIDNEDLVIAGFHDITIRKKAEQEIIKHRELLEEMVEERTKELTISEKKLQQSVKDISDYKFALDESSIVAITDSEGIIKYVNDNFCEISKYRRQELIGQNHSMLSSGLQTKEFFSNLWSTISSGSVWRGEIQNKAKDGSIYWVDSTIIPFLDKHKKPYQYVSVTFNITNRKSIEADLIKSKEKADSANLAKSEFLANMSHEIRTPMNAVIGFSELLAKSVKDNKQLAQVESIHSSGKNLLKVINDILDLSKVEAGKIEIIPVPINLTNHITEIENIFTQKVKEKRIDFSIIYENKIPQSLLLDEVRFRQILFNLIGNAVKFTDKGHINLNISYEKNSENQENIDLTILVEDTGVGIPIDQQELIFDAFNQKSGQSILKYGGTGLGLTITKKLIEKMGGSISLKSEIDKGSIFRIDLPNIPVLETIIDSKQKVFDTTTILFEPATILVVDDVEENRKLVIDLFENSPFVFIQAVNGKEAVEMAKKHIPNLIFMDLRMPVMDGYQAAEIIKKDKKTKAIPVLALTASMKSLSDKNHIKHVFDEYLFKPLDISQLFDSLKKYLKYEETESKTTYIEAVKYKLTEEEKDLAPKFIEVLESQYLPEYESIVKNQVINEIEDFSDSLLEISKKINYQILIDFCNELKYHSGNFNFEKLMQVLLTFPELINWLKSEIKNNNL